MSFFISDALAQAADGGAASAPGLSTMLLPVGIFALFYFLFIRPQNKRQKDQKSMIAALSKGAEVVTTGGILGKVVDLDENFVRLEVGDHTHIQVQRHAISSAMPKGTYKAQQKRAK